MFDPSWLQGILAGLGGSGTSSLPAVGDLSAGGVGNDIIPGQAPLMPTMMHNLSNADPRMLAMLAGLGGQSQGQGQAQLPQGIPPQGGQAQIPQGLAGAPLMNPLSMLGRR